MAFPFRVVALRYWRTPLHASQAGSLPTSDLCSYDGRGDAGDLWCWYRRSGRLS